MMSACKATEQDMLLAPVAMAAQYAFIGGGMMATALIQGIIAGGASPKSICVSDVMQSNLDRLAGVGVNTTTSNKEVISGAKAVFIAVKPDIVPQVLAEISPAMKDQLIISIAAGITLGALQERLPESTRVIRVMPNTPCLVGECAAAFAMGACASEEDRALVNELMGKVGIINEVKEKQMDAVTGLSGSGPAYVYMMIEAMADGGVRMGLPRSVAMQLAAQTVRGAATMVLKSGEHPGQLKDNVCSPGGTTIAGVEALENSGFRKAAMSAVVAASTRSKELGKPNP